MAVPERERCRPHNQQVEGPRTSEQQISKALFRPPKNLNQDDQGGGEENQSQNVLCQKVLESAADDQPDSEDRMLDQGIGQHNHHQTMTDKVATVSAKLAASAEYSDIR